MQAIEFNSQFEHGQISVPKTLHLVEGQAVRVLILLDETAAEKGAVQGDVKSVWERTAGAWQGNNLVREPQGEYEQRLELK
ncbi:MAG TPA: hypothetical protein PLU16_07340 [Gallionellaceae bacterium]|nr:hypothetical protein [Gallionellaceae bacterium]HQS75008.1 hypothetical protein [Gallionellaceae bacterium]